MQEQQEQALDPAELVYRAHVASGDEMSVEVLAACGNPVRTKADFDRHRKRRVDRLKAHQILAVNVPKLREKLRNLEAAAVAESRIGETSLAGIASVAELAALLKHYAAVEGSTSDPYGERAAVRTVAQQRVNEKRQEIARVDAAARHTLAMSAGGRAAMVELAGQQQQIITAIARSNPKDFATLIESARAQVYQLVEKPNQNVYADWKEQLRAARAKLAELEQQAAAPDVQTDNTRLHQQLEVVQGKLAKLEEARFDPENMDWT